MDLAAELLEVTDEYELDQFLGKLIRRGARAVGKAMRSPVGRSLAKQLLPIAGGAVGHARGAFTGAVAARDGAFALADGGTLFLDEVGELAANLQVQPLPVLQEHTSTRVGSNTWRHTAFRLICATNRELRTEQEAGRFGATSTTGSGRSSSRCRRSASASATSSRWRVTSCGRNAEGRTRRRSTTRSSCTC
ncbi:MAG: sigma-54 factor interaction domain-containing protein [Chloroflexi bacterium]|nr:sigma-54 factor interaction domain-containing protein [Chloroflexota bacterium]